jgi:hypothetical protein
VDKEGHPRNAVKFIVESLVLLAPGKEGKPDVVQPREGALEESRALPANDDCPF